MERNVLLTHVTYELGSKWESEWANEWAPRKARAKQREQCGASEWMSSASKWGSDPVVIKIQEILSYNALLINIAGTEHGARLAIKLTALVVEKRRLIPAFCLVYSLMLEYQESRSWWRQNIRCKRRFVTLCNAFLMSDKDALRIHCMSAHWSWDEKPLSNTVASFLSCMTCTKQWYTIRNQ